MKFLFPLLFLPILSYSQEKQGIRSMQIFTNKQLTLIADYDTAGNCVFMKNIGMNGPITMLFINNHDHQNRETKSFWAHSNLGFMLSENVYENNRILRYNYVGDSTTNQAVDREKLDFIANRNEFFSLAEVQALERSMRFLQSIDIIDSLNRTEIGLNLSENGDTTTITTRYFDQNWKDIRFRYESQTDSNWIWDIYYDYNEDGNEIKSYRVELNDGILDTSEVYNYMYDEFGRLIEENYYYRGDFQNKTLYQYNKKDQLIEELFFEQANDWDVVTDYKYDKKNGWIKKKVVLDLRLSSRERKKVLTYRYFSY